MWLTKDADHVTDICFDLTEPRQHKGQGGGQRRRQETMETERKWKSSSGKHQIAVMERRWPRSASPPHSCVSNVLLRSVSVRPLLKWHRSDVWPSVVWSRLTHRLEVRGVTAAVFLSGGVAHGPRGPTSYYYMLPMKVRVLGLKVALSSKMAQVTQDTKQSPHPKSDHFTVRSDKEKQKNLQFRGFFQNNFSLIFVFVSALILFCLDLKCWPTCWTEYCVCSQDYLHIVDSLNIPTPDSRYLLELIKQRHWGQSVLIVDVWVQLKWKLNIFPLRFAQYLSCSCCFQSWRDSWKHPRGNSRFKDGEHYSSHR